MARAHRIPYWDPEDTGAWEAGNRAIARRNLLWIVACDHVAFGIWTLWPVMVLFMPQNVYGFSAADKFLLGATATFVAAGLRIPYSLGLQPSGGLVRLVTPLRRAVHESATKHICDHKLLRARPGMLPISDYKRPATGTKDALGRLGAVPPNDG